MKISNSTTVFETVSFYTLKNLRRNITSKLFQFEYILSFVRFWYRILFDDFNYCENSMNRERRHKRHHFWIAIVKQVLFFFDSIEHFESCLNHNYHVLHNDFVARMSNWKIFRSNMNCSSKICDNETTRNEQRQSIAIHANDRSQFDFLQHNAMRWLYKQNDSWSCRVSSMQIRQNCDTNENANMILSFTLTSVFQIFRKWWVNYFNSFLLVINISIKSLI